MTRFPALYGAVAALLVPCALAQSTMTPLATFGTNGWLAPGSSVYLGTGHFERGLAYNSGTDNLVLVSRSGGTNVRLLHGPTGLDLGGFDVTGIAGGTFAVDMAAIADDGAIYVGNLTTSATSNFKVYKWASEALGVAPPTVAYDALSGVARTGDAFAVVGTGTATMFAAAGGTASATGTNSNFVLGPLDGTNASTAYLSIPGTGTTSNDYRLSLTFVDQNTLIGNQGGLARYTTFSGATATVVASIPLGASARRAMDYAVIAGTPVLAVIDSVSSLVSVFDIQVPGAPVLLTSGNATVGALAANTNATGSVQWGAISGNTATLYAMNTNHGIQAFQVVIQPPASATTYGAGCGAPALALSAVGAPILPSTIQLQVDNLPPTTVLGAYALGLISLPSGVPIPIAPGCLQYLVPLASVIFVPAGATHQLPQSYPADPAFAGLAIFAQAFALDMGGAITATNGLRLYLETF